MLVIYFETTYYIKVFFVFYCKKEGKSILEMESKEYYISLITSHTEELRKEFGVKSLRLFGSVARNEQKVGSDIDICVDIEANAFLVVRLKRFLEELLQCSVDIVRLHKHINSFLFQEIERDGIDVIK